MYWLFSPLYLTRLVCIRKWMKKHGWIIMWHGPGHWLDWPTLERVKKP